MPGSPTRLLVGSESDLKPVRASGMFDLFEAVSLEVPIDVVSAHRNAHDLMQIVGEDADTQFFIAAAGLACALPGAIIGADPLRRLVIAVPLDDYGIDSVLRLPPGTPVLVPGVGKHGLINAAHNAVRLAGLLDPEVAENYRRWSLQKAKVVVRDAQLPAKEVSS